MQTKTRHSVLFYFGMLRREFQGIKHCWVFFDDVELLSHVFDYMYIIFPPEIKTR